MKVTVKLVQTDTYSIIVKDTTHSLKVASMAFVFIKVIN